MPGDRLTLYHGSYCQVKKPDLAKCAAKKDFGQGFYLTTSRIQAENFIKSSIKKALIAGEIEKYQNFGYISIFQLNLQNNLAVYTYEDADINWLHCVTAHRKLDVFDDIRKEMSKYDIIIGKIADDATNATLTAYISGVFGIVGSNEADALCIKQLLPNRLKDQYCLKTETAIKCLDFMGVEKIWL